MHYQRCSSRLHVRASCWCGDRPNKCPNLAECTMSRSHPSCHAHLSTKYHFKRAIGHVFKTSLSSPGRGKKIDRCKGVPKRPGRECYLGLLHYRWHRFHPVPQSPKEREGWWDELFRRSMGSFATCLSITFRDSEAMALVAEGRGTGCYVWS